eukprot:CAMPEP_0119501826 /NCGR_PEP_ID=MMETSP1344-20130328/23517_1 /TAXON_ID=236787 /ORGANISM="Florenciella parvula, Strain CCMP2471" /LENGTH=44 /DNA_ID= /DNA_START= /DNA_END= /DNA_ORIENTATION=
MSQLADEAWVQLEGALVFNRSWSASSSGAPRPPMSSRSSDARRL